MIVAGANHSWEEGPGVTTEATDGTAVLMMTTDGVHAWLVGNRYYVIEVESESGLGEFDHVMGWLDLMHRTDYNVLYSPDSRSEFYVLKATERPRRKPISMAPIATTAYAGMYAIVISLNGVAGLIHQVLQEITRFL